MNVGPFYLRFYYNKLNILFPKNIRIKINIILAIY